MWVLTGRLPCGVIPARLDTVYLMTLLRPGHLIAFGRFLVAYFLAMALGLVLSRFDNGVAVVWFAGAVLFVQLITTPRRIWAAQMIGAVATGALAIVWFGFGTMAALPLALLGVLETAAAAALVKTCYRRFGRLQSISEIVWFIGIAGLLIPAIFALPAAAVIHWVNGMAFALAWRDWFAAHGLGFIAFAPPLLLVMRGEGAKWLRTATPADMREAAMLLTAVLFTLAITFGQNVAPLVLLPLIAMVAAVLRLGRFGAMCAVIITITVGLTASFAGMGPTTLLRVTMALKFEVLQLFFACTVAVLLLLAEERTARHRLLERVYAAETLQRLIVERASDVIIRLRGDGTVRFASPSVARLWGYLPDELLGRQFFDLIHPRDAPAVRASRQIILESPDGAATSEYRMQCKDGRMVWVEGSTRAILGHQGRVAGMLIVIRDVTDRRALIDDLSRQPVIDSLTGLANRRVFDQDLARGLAAGKPGCLALFDLDHFAQINDVHGADAGNRVLQAFAGVMRDSVRIGDTAIRLSGEEFAVLLFGASTSDAYDICQRILTRFAAIENRPSSGKLWRATASAGLAKFEPGTSPEAVLTAAETALYSAKNDGRNRISLSA